MKLEKKDAFVIGKFLKRLNVIFCVFVLVSCSSETNKQYSDPEELKSVYINDYKNVSIDIVFERGHNLHRIHAFHKIPMPELYIFHDKQIYKNLKIGEDQFKDLLARAIDTAGTFFRKNATKEQLRCRTPFMIKLKNSQNKFEVEGCRSSEEGVVFGKLIADIEYLASISSTR